MEADTNEPGEAPAPDFSLPDLDAIISSVADEPAPEPEAAPGAAPAAEAAPAPSPEETPAEPAPDPRVERGLAMVSERERKLREEREAWQSEQETTLKELEAYRAFKAKLQRNDALGALKDQGIEFDALSAAVLEGRGVNPTSALEETVNQKLTATEQRLQEKLELIERKQREADMATWRAIAASTVSEASPLVQAMGDQGIDMLYSRLEQVAGDQQHQGEPVNLPPLTDAVKELEKETLEFFTRFKDVPAVRELFTQSMPASPPNASPTLTNRHAASAPTRTLEPDLSNLNPGDNLIEAIIAKHRS